ncbi:hypothetical protein [Maribacter sp. 2308TA10-17]|uniref:hypothetical protein n=1 Tax=Maribacter sp. 2308TA10-17 TaxID=3386276 RepID=UPI0039BD1E07
MGKKNLDKLFQEKLKDFSEVPDEKVWQSIEASLDKKKKSRKIIPIWWKLGGIAAMLVLGLFLWNPFEDNSVNSPIITDVNNEVKKTSKEKKTDQQIKNQNSSQGQIVDTQKDNTSSEENDSSIEQIANANADSKKDLKSNSIKKQSQKETIYSQNSTAIKIAAGETQRSIDKRDAKNSKKEFAPTIQETAVVESELLDSKFKETPAQEIKIDSQEKPFSNEINTQSKEGIAQNEENNNIRELEEAAKKKSLFDEIAEQEQEEVVAENSGSRWSAGPSIAPVYFNAMGEGSPVHSIFVPNGKSGDVNLSYGLSIAYEVNKKLKIRSGVHKVDYGYRTNDIEFSSSLENATSDQIDNIDYTITSKSLVVTSKASSPVEASNQNSFLDSSSEDVSAESPARDGVMAQQFGYLEVPVELNYALVDKRFGINLIGGISSLFLVDNSISLSSGELTTDVGEANNINSVNFSTNVGFGVNYKFTPKVQLNIEPIFKYQLNTFSVTDGTFNPFSVGVYSGLSFKF